MDALKRCTKRRRGAWPRNRRNREVTRRTGCSGCVARNGGNGGREAGGTEAGGRREQQPRAFAGVFGVGAGESEMQPEGILARHLGRTRMPMSRAHIGFNAETFLNRW